MTEKFKALIVEDDEVNIKLLTLLLNKYCESIDIIGEAKNSLEFIDKLLALKPDILFLDIDIGEQKNTLEILKDLGELDCEIIIISSHKEYALKAINQYHVSNYILKPVKIMGLVKAVTDTVKKVAQKRAYATASNNNSMVKGIIGLPTATTIDLIAIDDVLYLEADGKYTIFYMTIGPSKIVSKNIGYYESFLPKHLFFRIHHKYIVNLTKATTIKRSEGTYCILKNGVSLSVANRRIERLRKFLHLK
jgi:two-component system LytT family response regulator